MNVSRIFLTLSLLLCLVLAAQAEPINPEQARKVATGFFFQRVSQIRPLAAKDISVAETREVSGDGIILYYVINFNKGGWVLVSGDDRAVPVIGYADAGEYGSKNMPGSLSYWMKNVEQTIRTAIQENLPASPDASAQWYTLLNTELSELPVFKSKAITPLLQSTWGQGANYNAMCPVAAGGPDDRALVGCVATSMSQVMYYYRWPLQGAGSSSYYHSSFGTISANYGTTTYRWNEMQNSVVSASEAAAELCFHAGVAVEMDYAADGSGSFTNLIPGAMETNFRYSSDISYKGEYLYSASTWAGMLTDNLDAMHPVIYSGTDPAPTGGGHAWVCDGYQGTDYFHMNWGWDGGYDGYFYLDALTVGTTTFSNYQGAVFNIYPVTTSYPTSCSGTTTLTTSRGSIADGSGPANYANNANCQWLIDPAEVISKISIDFYALNLETGDAVTIYDGDNTSAPVIGTYTGSTLPSSVYTTGDKALVVFTSDGAVNNSGWYLEYRSYFPVYCSGVITLTAPSGTITDGSATSDYSYNQLCRWVIQPANAEVITIDFTDFNVAADDWVKIYNGASVLGNYFGSTLPSQLVCNASSVIVTFKTDAANNAPGWTLNYTSTTAGLIENPAFGSFVMYPNPAQDKVSLEFTPAADRECKVEIMTVEGRVIMHKEYSDISGILKTEFDISALSEGIYFFRISGASGSLITKLVVE